VTPPKPAPHLPFRRISIPTTPSPHLHRQSGVSVTSVDSITEDGVAAIPRSKNLLKKKSGSITADNGGKRSRKKDVRKPLDEAREAKRRKVVLELFETERAYVDGLDLIYFVSFEKPPLFVKEC
jgi:FYVE/RhoGEF/PH domain-containing protein 5/6